MNDKEVVGEFVGHSAARGFLWLYICEHCEKKFQDTSPTVSAPAICHQCYIGGDYATKRKKKRIASRKQRRFKTLEE